MTAIAAGGRTLGVWHALENDDSAGSWDRLNIVITLVIATLAAFAAYIPFLQGRRARHAAARTLAAPPETGPPQLAAEHDPNVADRDAETGRLTAMITDDEAGVIVVTGAPGIGTSTLVIHALEANGMSPDYSHQVTPQTFIDVAAIVFAIELSSGRPVGAVREDEPVLARLEMAIDSLDGQPILIVIDSAHHQFDETTGQLEDLALEEAFEAVASRPRCGVKIVLITRTIPVAAEGGTWVRPDRCVEVGGLPFNWYNEVLMRRTGGRRRGQLALTEVTQQRLYHRFGGNLRSAELFLALTTDAQAGQDPIALAGDVLRANEDAGEFLAGMLMERAGSLRRGILRALAAFGAPVDISDVAALISIDDPQRDASSQGAIEYQLHELVSLHVVRAGTENFYLPFGDLDRLLTERPSETSRADLLFGAFKILRTKALNAGSVESVQDLHSHFAAVQALLRAGHWDAAFRLIVEIDKVLSQWNAGSRLLASRALISDRLLDDGNRMANYNSLGNLYRMRGDIPRARHAYAQARRIAGDDENITMKIDVNLASMHWAANEVDLAQGRYQAALDTAQRQHRAQVQASAYEGLARCARRLGDYPSALEYGRRAFEAAEPDRLTHVAIRLARWHHELEDDEAALHWLAVAKPTHRTPQRSLQAAYLDASADILLERDQRTADRQALQAVDLALPMHDPIITLQARTTLCWSRLLNADAKGARREILKAERYRGGENYLIVLALLGITHHEADSAKACDYFRALLRSAEPRTVPSRRDFAARQLAGVAHCGLYLADESTLDKAIESFESARNDLVADRPVRLLRRLDFLLCQLDSAEHPRLGPVRDVLRRDLIAQH
ncbi:tetratricopeptide repeat protein [Dactylosporangium sp. NPDC005555]|uniref:tetratricopeptide repeat protein n=1 Tax=Dactylosporangium sp. NPDC005555 TaxID=3154889 RepID=UPI0033B2DCB0